MIQIIVPDYETWRNKARECLQANIPPDEIYWLDAKETQAGLLSELQTESIFITAKQQYLVPKAFFDLAETIAYHRANHKWEKLYLALWRLTHGEKNLLKISIDPLVRELDLMAKAVKRDCHKMKAFVRFHKYQSSQGEFYIAWHQPDHPIAKRMAGFFKRRFAVMHWIIITPDDTLVWDGEKLKFLPGVPHFKHQHDDQAESLWKTYYRATFNPARIKIKAMKREMPVRYWQNLPETEIINDLLAEAPQRMAQMIKHAEGLATSARDYFPEEITYTTLKQAAHHCQACPIFRCAKQTVFGKGPLTATLMIVGEQPGTQEDAAGEPLIGPSGVLIRETLRQAKGDLTQVYFTNAVKHFKHSVSAGKIIYQTPVIREINACKPWLEAEIELIKPQVIITLGLVAAKSLLSGGFHMKKQRGVVHTYQHIPVVPTYHPAAILRAIDPVFKAEMHQLFFNDVQRGVKLLT